MDDWFQPGSLALIVGTLAGAIYVAWGILDPTTLDRFFSYNNDPLEATGPMAHTVWVLWGSCVPLIQGIQTVLGDVNPVVTFFVA